MKLPLVVSHVNSSTHGEYYLWFETDPTWQENISNFLN